MSDAKRHRYEDLPPSQIAEDPARFQSRAAYPRDWMDEDLDSVELYNVNCAGVISVWRDPEDEKLYVIDGHRRLRLAEERAERYHPEDVTEEIRKRLTEEAKHRGDFSKVHVSPSSSSDVVDEPEAI